MTKVRLDSLYPLYDESWKEAILRCAQRSKGLRVFEDSPGEACYLCGRQEDRLFAVVKLVPFLDDQTIRFVCLDHRDITGPQIFDCLTGELVTVPSQKSRGALSLRDRTYAIFLKVIIAFRFVWFLALDIIIWKVFFRLRLVKKRILYDKNRT